jgi:hypothetical protein
VKLNKRDRRVTRERAHSLISPSRAEAEAEAEAMGVGVILTNVRAECFCSSVCLCRVESRRDEQAVRCGVVGRSDGQT